MRKSMPTLGVVGAYTGRVLEERGFPQIHEVFDHLYPGIMTLGVAAMAEQTKAYLARTIPALVELPELPPGGELDLRAFAALALEKFGPTIDVEGPYNATEQEMREFGERVGAMLKGKAVIAVEVK